MTAFGGSERPPKESGSHKKFGGGSRRPLSIIFLSTTDSNKRIIKPPFVYIIQAQ